MGPASRGAARARSRASRPRPPVADRDHASRDRRRVPGRCHGQRRRATDPRQPPPDRGPAHLALIHRPRLPQPLGRAGSARTDEPRARGCLRQYPSGRPENQAPALPGDLGARGQRAPDGARRLVPASQISRRARRALRVLRSRLAREVPAVSAVSQARPAPILRASARLPSWWPLAALTLLAAALRLSTIDLQSFWYDEAFTPVRVLHSSLGATLRGVS